MTTLYVPLHLPVHQADRFLQRELGHRDVQSVKVIKGELVISHERMPREPYMRSLIEL